MEILIDDMMLRFTSNPFCAMSPYFATKEIFTIDTRYFANCYALRGYLADVINERKR